MADTAPAKKATKTKKTTTAKPAAHPSYTEMVELAVKGLADKKGSSGIAIRKYISANFKVEQKSMNLYVRNALKRGIATGALKQSKGTGASGSFKIAEKAAPKKAAVKKPAAKSPKKAAKKPAAKKAAKSPKKAAVKKAVKSPKKSTKKAAKSPAKKPVAKKAKKPAAKKTAAKK